MAKKSLFDPTYEIRRKIIGVMGSASDPHLELSRTVGRMVAAAPGCRVLCVYLRGDSQETWSDYPAKGERILVSLACIEPKSDHRGVRRTRDLSQQIVSQLIRMEEKFFEQSSGNSIPGGPSDDAGGVEV